MDDCKLCHGYGTYTLGFMITECRKCTQDETFDAPALDKINRRSKSYQTAIKDIMEIHPEISRKEAVKMFDEAYEKDG